MKEEGLRITKVGCHCEWTFDEKGVASRSSHAPQESSKNAIAAENKRGLSLIKPVGCPMHSAFAQRRAGAWKVILGLKGDHWSRGTGKEDNGCRRAAALQNCWRVKAVSYVVKTAKTIES